MNIKLDYSKTGLTSNVFTKFEAQIMDAHEKLHNKSGKGNDFVGWVDHPTNYDKIEFERIIKAADKIKNHSEILLVIGIGGSYLGAKAAIEALSHSFYNLLNHSDRKTPQVFFVGQNISGKYLKELTILLKDKDFSINVISKSGTTTEPAIAFRYMKKLLIERYGKEGAKDRIFATTDKAKGALRTLADKEDYETFVIQDDIGGRYSVFTAVGLLPMAVSGIDIRSIMDGVVSGYETYKNKDIHSNPCYQYAALRNELYQGGKKIEILVNYEPHLHFVSEWWKQLYGESEGKDHQGLFPAAVDFSTDLQP